MATTREQVEKIYSKILIPLGIIYTAYINEGRGPTGVGSGACYPDKEERRVFSAIPLKFGSIMGHQFGIFLGDLASEQMLYPSFFTDRTAIIINVDEINKSIPDINENGVALLLAHELGHAYRWYMGHKGGDAGYTNEVWARSLELAYVEGLQHSIHAAHIGVSFHETVQFIKKYRKVLYKGNPCERKFYTELTGDGVWESEVKNTASKCPNGNPACFRPPQMAMLHVACKPD